MLTAEELPVAPLTNMLMTLRGYGGRAWRWGRGAVSEKPRASGFTKLDEVPGRELVFGIAGKFWRPDGGLRSISDRDAFVAFGEEGYVKGAWNLRVDPVEAASCELSTETRIQCFGSAARRKFRLYWMFIRPFSGMIRMEMLRGIRRRAETLPRGDRLT